MIEQNPKERFENIKKSFYQSQFDFKMMDSTIEVSKNFIEDFKYLIKLVDLLDKRNHIENKNKTEKLKPIKEYEMCSYIDIIKMLSENREKINEIIEGVVKQ